MNFCITLLFIFLAIDVQFSEPRAKIRNKNSGLIRAGKLTYDENNIAIRFPISIAKKFFNKSSKKIIEVPHKPQKDECFKILSRNSRDADNFLMIDTCEKVLEAEAVVDYKPYKIHFKKRYTFEDLLSKKILSIDLEKMSFKFHDVVQHNHKRKEKVNWSYQRKLETKTARNKPEKYEIPVYFVVEMQAFSNKTEVFGMLRDMVRTANEVMKGLNSRIYSISFRIDAFHFTNRRFYDLETFCKFANKFFKSRNIGHATYISSRLNSYLNYAVARANFASMCSMDEEQKSCSIIHAPVWLALDKLGRAAAFAHEIGHTLQSQHDGVGEGIGCPNDKFVMAPYLVATMAWSKCSKSQIAKFIADDFAWCIRLP